MSHIYLKPTGLTSPRPCFIKWPNNTAKGETIQEQLPDIWNKCFQAGWASQVGAAVTHLATSLGNDSHELPAEAKHPSQGKHHHANHLLVVLLPFCLMTIQLCRHWWMRTIYRPTSGLKNSLTKHDPKLSFCSPSQTLHVQSQRSSPAPLLQGEMKTLLLLHSNNNSSERKYLDRAILPLGRVRMDGGDLPQRQRCRGHTYLIQGAMLPK